jgi:hypothetical protein
VLVQSLVRPAARRGGSGPGRSGGETIASLEGLLAGLGRQRLRAAMGTRAFDAGYAAGLTLGLAQVAAAPGSTDTAAGQARGSRIG